MMKKVSVYFCLLLFLFSCSASKIQFQTLEDMSGDHLSSTYVCSRASTNGSKNGASSSSSSSSRLEVVHRHGPCADQEGSKKQVVASTNLSEILAKDQLRVQSIQKSLHHLINYTNNKEATGDDTQIQLPIQSGDSLDSGNYVVTIGLGTPRHELTLIFDTGSDVTWTQCLPFYPRDCYPQKEALFQPSASFTYSRIPCNSQYCADLGKIKRGGSSCVHLNHNCTYRLYYGDGSRTSGFYSRDKLTLSPNDVFLNFRFGCGNDNSMNSRVAGILGLGRGLTSIVSQRKNKYSGLFSYCLPPDISSTGFLSFGGEYNNNNGETIFTPFVGSRSLSKYHIEITAISVGGTKLLIMESIFTTAGAIIDSGTVLTRLPPAAYKAMRIEFSRMMMLLNYKSAPAYDDLLDTCFHITRKDKVPTISFTFKGDATIHLARSGILYYINSRLACLAFVENKSPADYAIFGNTQQLNFEVMYDVQKNQLGFRRNPRCL